MNLYRDLEWRGLIKQTTSPDLEKTLSSDDKITLYCGFDPTADSLHLGSLLPLVTLRRFQKQGHRVIALVGGATGMIGDPSFKSAERKLQDEAGLQKNLAGISSVIRRFLDFQGPNAAEMVNNYDWMKNFSFLSFLRDVGKHFTVNHMMAKESVRARLEDRENGISFTEFSYMLLQAYDFYHLHREKNCVLQIGGSDQWGNITAGTELTRRMNAAEGRDSGQALFGMTFPLVTKSDGTKFGKTETGTIWLSADKTSPYQLYQFLLQTSDADVVTYLKFFTELSVEQIGQLEDSIRTKPELREAQTQLAEQVTRLVHGEAALQEAQVTTELLFKGEISKLSLAAILAAFQAAPQTDFTPAHLVDGATEPTLIDLLVLSTLAPSKGQARKDIQGGGISINGRRIDDPAYTLQASDWIEGQAAVLRKGKKNYHLVIKT